MNISNSIITATAAVFGVDLYEMGYFHGLKRARELINQEMKKEKGV